MTPWRLTLALILALTLIDTCKHRTSRAAHPYLRATRALGGILCALAHVPTCQRASSVARTARGDSLDAALDPALDSALHLPPSENQHRVAVTEETVLAADRFGVDFLEPGQAFRGAGRQEGAD